MLNLEISSRNFERGETFRVRLRVVNPDNTPKDLTGAEVHWALFNPPGVAATTDKTIGNGVLFEGAPTDGVLVATLLDDESTGLSPELYYQEWHIKDGLGDVQIYRGGVGVLQADFPLTLAA